MIRIQHVLVATDFGEPSEAALDYGREVARAFGSTLHVLHVANSVSMQYGGEAYSVVLPELQDEIEAAARQKLDAALSQEDRTILHAKPVVVAATGKAAAIVDYASQHHIDLIVMGTHGGGFFSHVLMGSVAERVVRTAPCPVLTVHHPEHRFIEPDALVAVATA
jgi:nucleotide-binding universal stress UspA family protein